MLTYEKINDLIINSVRHNLPFDHYRIFYFGSRVSGRASSRSDLDVGIEAGRKIPLNALTKIKDELENIPVLQKIDLVDFSRVPEDFAIEARKDIMVIYEQ